MFSYRVTDIIGSSIDVSALYYGVDDNGAFVDFKDDKHKLVASFNRSQIASIIRLP